MRDIVR